MEKNTLPLINMKLERPICVAGNLNIDLIIRHVPHLPRWGQEIAGTDHIAVSSGQGGYMSLALARLDAPVRVVGNVGHDPFGQQILDDLRNYNADLREVEVLDDVKTGITVAIVREDGERAFVSDFGCSRSFTDDLLTRHWDAIQTSSILCFVGIFCLPNLNLVNIARAMEKVRDQGVITMLDTGWDPNNWKAETLDQIKTVLRHTSLFIPNLDEARIISGVQSPEEAASLLQSTGPEIVVIKLGAQGTLARVGQRTIHQPAFPTEVFDTVGAGDEFDAAFLMGTRLGWNIKDCLIFGNAAAACYISRERDRYPTVAEVLSFLKLNNHVFKIPETGTGKNFQFEGTL